MNERDELIKRLIKEKGGSRKDYLNLMESIAHHETSGTLDPTIKQIGGGPGRGKYQFEIGKNAGGITAAKRVKKYYNDNDIPVPNWLATASKSNDLDASTLTSEQQDILFLGNMRQHPKADFSKVWDKKESTADFWANYHWAGGAKDRAKRVASFNESQSTRKEGDKPVLKMKQPTEVREVQVDNTNVAVDEPKQKFLLDYLTENQLSNGGYTPSVSNELFNSFNAGGTHEQNPHGGVPQGMGVNGKINTVEEGETSFNTNDGKYIFSDRIII